VTILVETLRPLFAPGVMSARARNSTSFHSLLCDSKIGFFVNHGSGWWDLDFGEKDRLAGYLAYDSNRMGGVAFQSFETARVGMKDRLRVPWALIQAYYAAYYAGHAVLCIFGRNSKQLDSSVVSYLNRIFKAQANPPPQLAAGLHLIAADVGGTRITLSPLPAGKSHQRFWELFHSEIRRVSNDVLRLNAPQQDTQDTSVKLAALLSSMEGPQQHKGWLSQVRNEVQYKHERDVWWFTKKTRDPNANALSGIMNTWRADPMDIELSSLPDELTRFIASCTFLVSLCRSVLEEVGKHGKFQPPALAFPSLRK